MTAILLWLASNPTVVAIVGGILAALGWGYSQRRAGAKTERAKQDRARADAIKDRKDIDDEVENLGPADLDVRFDRWRMPDDRR